MKRINKITIWLCLLILFLLSSASAEDIIGNNLPSLLKKIELKKIDSQISFQELKIEGKNNTIVKVENSLGVYLLLEGKVCAYLEKYKNEYLAKIEIEHKYKLIHGLTDVYYDKQWLENTEIFKNDSIYKCKVEMLGVFTFDLKYIQFFVFYQYYNFTDLEIGKLIPYCYELGSKSYFETLINYLNKKKIEIESLDKFDPIKPISEIVFCLNEFAQLDGFGISVEYKKEFLTCEFNVKRVESFDTIVYKGLDQILTEIDMLAKSNLKVDLNKMNELIFENVPELQRYTNKNDNDNIKIISQNSNLIYIVSEDFIRPINKFIEMGGAHSLSEFKKRNNFFKKIFIYLPYKEYSICYNNINEGPIIINDKENPTRCLVCLSSFANSEFIVYLEKKDSHWQIVNYTSISTKVDSKNRFTYNEKPWHSVLIKPN